VARNAANKGWPEPAMPGGWVAHIEMLASGSACSKVEFAAALHHAQIFVTV
jgi:hypothetical protein